MKRSLTLAGIAMAFLLVALIWFRMFPEITEVQPEIDYQDGGYVWNARIGVKDGDWLVRGEKIDEIRHDINKLIFAFNRSDKNPEYFRSQDATQSDAPPKLKWIEQGKGIVTVEVINAWYLTQRMGTTGADAFMATAVYTLTEHETVDAVHFVFPKGDHALPGVYSRDIFRNRWRIEGEPGDGKPPPKSKGSVVAGMILLISPDAELSVSSFLKT